MVKRSRTQDAQPCRRLQAVMLDSVCAPWAVRWYRVPVHSMARSHSEEQLAADAGPEMAEEEQAGSRAAG